MAGSQAAADNLPHVQCPRADAHAGHTWPSGEQSPPAWCEGIEVRGIAVVCDCANPTFRIRWTGGGGLTVMCAACGAIQQLEVR